MAGQRVKGRVGAALVVAAALAASAAPAVGQYPGAGPVAPNPCVGADAAELLCPDLRMAPPREMFTSSGGGKVLLHAANDIQSRGEGPLEIRGTRISKRRMSVRQAIHRSTGGPRLFETNARLIFYDIPGQGPYWKFHFAALFEIWSLDSAGNRLERVRKGPKVNYCFRDLERTQPSARSPRRMVYPACSQEAGKRKRTLGTSVGWSDVYPSTYHQNWVNVRGLRGCFDFVLTADPQNHLYENDESNNAGSRRIRLPASGKGKVRGC
ncbi:MAG: hypothetical protein ACXWF9_08250 [Solirubrobacterales bacterium]